MMSFSMQASAYYVQYSVTVVDDGIIMTYPCSELEYASILEQNAIEIGPKDVIDISLLDSEEKLVIKRYKEITLNIDGEKTTHSTFQYDVTEFLKEAGVDMTQKEVVTKDLVLTNGCEVELKTEIPFSFSEYGKEATQRIAYAGETIKEWLTRYGFSTDTNYAVIGIDIDSAIEEGSNIEYHLVTEKTTEVESVLPYNTITRNDSSLKRGETKIIQKGQDGVEVTTRISRFYDNQSEPFETEEKKTTKIEPVQQIVAVNKGKSGSSKYQAGDVIAGHKSHYCACSKCGTGSGGTASGLKVHNGMDNPYIVACNWLPLGSVIKLDGVEYTVADRGGSRLSRSGWVDVFTPEGHKACYRKGIGSCTIEIVSIG